MGARGFILYLSNDPGFVALIKEDLKPFSPIDDQTPAEQRAWVERLKNYVPLLLKGLRSSNGCIQHEAIWYLARTEDPRAVEPLFGLFKKYSLNSKVGIDAFEVLTSVYLDPRTIPYVVKMIEKAPVGPILNIALTAAGGRLRDERLWHALVQRFEKPPPQPYANIIRVTANQAEAVHDKQEVVTFFRHNASRDGFNSSAAVFTGMIASPDTFDDIAAYYHAHCKNNNGDCLRIATQLTNIGGPKVAPFWIGIMKDTKNPQMRSYAATQTLGALAKELPARIASSGQDLLTWLERRGGEALFFARQGSASAILLRAPEATPYAPIEQRAAYWEKAAALLKVNKATYSWIELKLYKIYGPQGLADYEKALAAITEALNNYTPSYYYGKKPQAWIRYRDVLRRKLRSLHLMALIRIKGLSPEKAGEPLGPWKGELVLPAGAVAEVQAADPFAYLEVVNAEGKITPIASEVRLQDSLPGDTARIPFLVIPGQSKEVTGNAILQVRLMLLFLPRTSGFSGSVLSPLVQVR